MATSFTRRIVPGAAALALLFGAGLTTVGCTGNEDVSQEKFLEDFSETSPLDDGVDECIVDELFAQLDQEELNDFYGEDTDQPLSASNAQAVEAASSKCATEAAGEIQPEPDTGATTTTTTG